VPGFRNEVLVMCTVLSHDLVNEPDVVAMIAASAALTLSGAPFRGPIAAARVGFVNGEYVLNPSVDDMQNLRSNPEQRLDLVVAGTQDAVMMVESEAYELSEAEMLGAVTFAHAQMQPVIDLIIDLARRPRASPSTSSAVTTRSAPRAEAWRDAMREAFAIRPKQDRVARHRSARGRSRRSFRRGAADPNSTGDQGSSPTCCAATSCGAAAIDGAPRPGAAHRGADGALPRTHGSALFTRGESRRWS
jgi:polyribonucleotide nucleotidyltransferase